MKLTSPLFDDEEIALFRQCLESGWVTQGPLVAQFEALVAERHNCKHALAATSCTAALHMAMLALGIGEGDEVIVPAFTWVTSASVAEFVGARVVFADVLADTYNLDPKLLEAAITPKTRAVVPVHLFGLAAEMAQILEIARRHDLFVIEGAACAIGTTHGGRPVGCLGDIGCFSFHPRKVITTGEGGMLTTNRDDLAAVVQSIKNHGSTGQPPEELESPGPWTMSMYGRLGLNFRLSDILAAVGIAQMGKLEGLFEERLALAEAYRLRLKDRNDVMLPPGIEAAPGHTYQSYVIRVKEGGRKRRNQIMAVMEEDGIETRPGTHAVHSLGYYEEKYGYRSEDFPVAMASADETITLPIFPGMSEEDQDAVVASLVKGLSMGKV